MLGRDIPPAQKYRFRIRRGRRVRSVGRLDSGPELRCCRRRIELHANKISIPDVNGAIFYSVFRKFAAVKGWMNQRPGMVEGADTVDAATVSHDRFPDTLYTIRPISFSYRRTTRATGRVRPGRDLVSASVIIHSL